MDDLEYLPFNGEIKPGKELNLITDNILEYGFETGDNEDGIQNQLRLLHFIISQAEKREIRVTYEEMQRLKKWEIKLTNCNQVKIVTKYDHDAVMGLLE